MTQLLDEKDPEDGAARQQEMRKKVVQTFGVTVEEVRDRVKRDRMFYCCNLWGAPLKEEYKAKISARLTAQITQCDIRMDNLFTVNSHESINVILFRPNHKHVLKRELTPLLQGPEENQGLHHIPYCLAERGKIIIL